MLICSAHGRVIDRDHRECPEKVVGGCIMAGRGGIPFSDYELSYLEAGESWRTRLLEDPAPHGPDPNRAGGEPDAVPVRVPLTHALEALQGDRTKGRT